MSKYPEFNTFHEARRYCAENGLLGKVHLENPESGRVRIEDKPKPKPPKLKEVPADD